MPAPSSITLAVAQLAGKLAHQLAPIAAALGAASNDDALYRQLGSAIDDCLAGLSRLGVWGPENRLPSSELWNAAGHLLSRGWLQNQARTKPRGYAGDHELLSRIYEWRLCDDPLGRLFDRYFQEQAAPEAVRNRMTMMAHWIAELVLKLDDSPLTTHNSPHIALVGSAFGLEIKDALRRLGDRQPSRLRVTLLDLDPAAIDFARHQLAEFLPPVRLIAISANLFRLPERPKTAELLDGADLLFCPGLFDYLADDAAAPMLACLYAQLAPGGRMVVFQFAPHNPTRAYMEWFANWYLTYRDTAQLRRLVDSAELPAAQVTFGAEPLGIDLYVALTKPASEP